MSRNRQFRAAVAALAVAVGGCASVPQAPGGSAAAMDEPTILASRTTVHDDGDDLLTAGLGLAGLQSPAPPAFAVPPHPTSADSLRAPILSNWPALATPPPGG